MLPSRRPGSWNPGILASYLLYRGSTRAQQAATGRHSPPQAATGCPTFCARMSPWAHFWLQNHNKNDAETKGLEGRFKGRKRVARHPIRSCLCSPNAFSHFPKKFKISSKMYSLWVSISLSLEPFSKLSSSSGSRAPRPRPKVGTR